MIGLTWKNSEEGFLWRKNEKKLKVKKPRNQQDLTLRNLRALKKRIEKLEEQMREVCQPLLKNP